METSEAYNRRTLRLPPDAASFIEQEAKRNLTSQNAEVVRSIRERMRRENETAGEPAKTAPTV